jgi:uncharacterized sulfatase
MLRPLLLALILASAAFAAELPKPNILWLVNEDHGPDLGCYGDPYATTPTFDALAAKGLRYARCWSNAPVCAPARTTLICGLYAISTGGEHMRSMVAFPAGKKMYPQLLRETGYYCTNNAKEDYNVSKPGEVWNESSKKAHWRNRPDGAPFMAVFNSEKSHESQIRTTPHTLVHDPAKVRVPAYHPDTPEVRHDWAQYYDGVTAADADAGARLRELAEAGLTEETIVFYYADHGSGMPGLKRWPLNRGLQVPLIVYIPEKFASLRPPEYKAGGASDRLVSFVDFAPTLCSLAGVKPPEWLQGHAFLGPYTEPPQPFLFGFRGRMDERVDCIRSVTDGRFVYARNFRPDLIYGQHLEYMWQTPTTPVWERLFHEGKLTPAQAYFWKPKAPEELYDLTTDRDEVHNLTTERAQKPVLEKLRAALDANEARIRDVGLLPEGEMHRRSAGSTPYDLAHDDAKYPFARIYALAKRAASLDPAATPELVQALADRDSGIRYWGCVGLLMRKAQGLAAGRAALEKALTDESPDVRFIAAEALGRFGTEADLQRVLPLLTAGADPSKNDVFTAMAALTAITNLGEKAAPLASTLKTLPAKAAVPDARFSTYIPRMLEDLRERFK